MAALVGFCLLVPWLGYPLCAVMFVAILGVALPRGFWLD
jgi:hypothetical protein